MEIGKIEPKKITIEEYNELQNTYNENPEIESNSKFNIIKWLPVVIFIIGLFFIKQTNPKIFIPLCVLLVLLYIGQLRNALRLIKTGNILLARKSLIYAFIPMIGSVNTAVYSIINNKTANSYISTFVSGLDAFKSFLVSTSPEYGAYAYWGVIGVIVLGLNSIAIRGFIKFLKLSRLIGRI